MITTKKLLIALVVLITLIIILVTMLMRESAAREEVVEDLNETLIDLENLRADIKKMSMEFDRLLTSSIDDLITMVKEDGYQEALSTNVGAQDVQIYIGNKTFVKDVDRDNLEEMNDTIILLEKVNFKLNHMVLEESQRRHIITRVLTNEVISIITNVERIVEKVETMGAKPITFSVGINANYLGQIESPVQGLPNITRYSIGIHGMVFFKEQIYGGIELGIIKGVDIQPNIGVTAGYRFK